MSAHVATILLWTGLGLFICGLALMLLSPPFAKTLHLPPWVAVAVGLTGLASALTGIGYFILETHHM